MKNYLFIILTLFCAFSLSAQNETTAVDYEDVIYLNDGSIFRGKILEYDPEVSLKFKSIGGLEIVFKPETIKKIIQERIGRNGVGETVLPVKPLKEYNFKEKGFYNVTTLDLKSGTTAWGGNFILGTGINNVFGYQFNRLLGIGLGFGADFYYPSAGETVYPVFVELRTYLVKELKSPFFTLAGGYAFATINENKNITEAKGGLLLHPAFGYRLGGSDNGNLTFDIGVKFQKATWTRQIWDNNTQTQQMVYKRVTLRLGLLF